MTLCPQQRCLDSSSMFGIPSSILSAFFLLHLFYFLLFVVVVTFFFYFASVWVIDKDGQSDHDSLTFFLYEAPFSILFAVFILHKFYFSLTTQVFEILSNCVKKTITWPTIIISSCLSLTTIIRCLFSFKILCLSDQYHIFLI